MRLVSQAIEFKLPLITRLQTFIYQNIVCIQTFSGRNKSISCRAPKFSDFLKSAVTPPRVMITDKFRSYGAASAKIGLRVDHHQHKGLNNRAENSDLPTRTDDEAI